MFSSAEFSLQSTPYELLTPSSTFAPIAFHPALQTLRMVRCESIPSLKLPTIPSQETKVAERVSVIRQVPKQYSLCSNDDSPQPYFPLNGSDKPYFSVDVNESPLSSEGSQSESGDSSSGDDSPIDFDGSSSIRAMLKAHPLAMFYEAKLRTESSISVLRRTGSQSASPTAFNPVIPRKVVESPRKEQQSFFDGPFFVPTFGIEETPLFRDELSTAYPKLNPGYNTRFVPDLKRKGNSPTPIFKAPFVAHWRLRSPHNAKSARDAPRNEDKPTNPGSPVNQSAQMEEPMPVQQSTPAKQDTPIAQNTQIAQTQRSTHITKEKSSIQAPLAKESAQNHGRKEPKTWRVIRFPKKSRKPQKPAEKFRKSCEICDKTFVNVFKLNKHKLVHGSPATDAKSNHCL